MLEQLKHNFFYAIALLCCLFSFLLLSACSQDSDLPTMVYPRNADTTNLDHLLALRQVKFDKAEQKINPIRLEGIREAAMTLGAQGALAKRTLEINAILRKDTPYLNHIFNFNLLILDNNVLPPVLTEGQRTLNLEGTDSIRIADRTYVIAQQARFVTAPPTWRDYLWMNYKKPDVPDKSLLPKDEEEVAVWQHYVQIGWDQGVEQANNIFDENVSHVTRDYVGMALYRKLYNERMISAPFVAKTKLGITGGGNDLTINDEVLRITSLPSLNPEGQEWHPAVMQPQ